VPEVPGEKGIAEERRARSGHEKALTYWYAVGRQRKGKQIFEEIVLFCEKPGYLCAPISGCCGFTA
jgi:hypothetical protein